MLARPVLNQLMTCELAEHKKLPTHQHALMDAATVMWLNRIIEWMEVKNEIAEVERSENGPSN